MSGAVFGVFAIAGTEEIGLFPLVIVGAAVIQFFAAVGTIEQPGKDTHDTAFGRSAAVLTKLLDQRKGFPVDDRRMGVREYLPILLGPVNPLL